MTVICLRRGEIAAKKDYIKLLEKGKAYEGDKVIVDPTPSEEELAEDPCSIPIRLGDHWIRLMARERKIEGGNKLRIEPFESVLVISMEYIALPRDKMAIMLPRARVLQRGLLIHTARVHPTWHGKLAFVIVNLSRHPIEIETGAQIASMVVLKAEEGGALPPRKDLGRESLHIDLERLAKEPVQLKDAVREVEEVMKDISELAERYGPPFNIIAEGIGKRFEVIYEVVKEGFEYIRKELQSDIEEEIDKKVKSEVERKISIEVIPSMHTWMGAIVVVVLTLAVAFIQFTQAAPRASDTTANFNQCIDLVNLLLTKIAIPFVMLLSLVYLAHIFSRIRKGIDNGRKNSRGQ